MQNLSIVFRMLLNSHLEFSSSQLLPLHFSSRVGAIALCTFVCEVWDALQSMHQCLARALADVLLPDVAHIMVSQYDYGPELHCRHNDEATVAFSFARRVHIRSSETLCPLSRHPSSSLCDSAFSFPVPLAPLPFPFSAFGRASLICLAMFPRGALSWSTSE